MEATKDELVKASITDAAKDLFQQYGLAKTTMEDIAKAIGKGKSSLYYYYATKEDIFEAVVHKEREGMLKETCSVLETAHTAEDKLRVFALTIYRALQKRTLLFNIINSDSSDKVYLMRMFRKKYDNIEIELMKSIIAFGIENGEFKEKYRNQVDNISMINIAVLRSVRLNLIKENTSENNMLKLINLSIDLLVDALKK